MKQEMWLRRNKPHWFLFLSKFALDNITLVDEGKRGTLQVQGSSANTCVGNCFISIWRSCQAEKALIVTQNGASLTLRLSILFLQTLHNRIYFRSIGASLFDFHDDEMLCWRQKGWYSPLLVQLCSPLRRGLNPSWTHLIVFPQV